MPASIPAFRTVLASDSVSPSSGLLLGPTLGHMCPKQKRADIIMVEYHQPHHTNGEWRLRGTRSEELTQRSLTTAWQRQNLGSGVPAPEPGQGLPWQVGQQWPGLRTGSGQGLGRHFTGTQCTRLLCNVPTAVRPPGLAPRESAAGRCQAGGEVGHRVRTRWAALWLQVSEDM